MSPADRDHHHTRDAILDAAEQLFATDGYVATSLRHLTREAGVNLAAVHYHFGSKEGLLGALFERRLGPLNEQRLRLLEAAEQAAAPDPAPVAAIMHAFAAPAIEAGVGRDEGFCHFMKLVGRSHAQESEEMSRIFHQQFASLIQRFGAALQRALPDLPVEEIYWRMHFCAGAFSHTLMNRDKVRWVSDGLCDPDDPAGVTARLVSFLSAGMTAPLPDVPDPSKKPARAPASGTTSKKTKTTGASSSSSSSSGRSGRKRRGQSSRSRSTRE